MINKDNIKNSLTIENIFELLTEWGGEPKYTDFGILSATICHNPVGEGSHKLYYYENSKLFKCYTGCDNDTFDIFELYIKVIKNQKNQDISFFSAIKYISLYFSIQAFEEEQEEKVGDWELFSKYSRIKEIESTKLNYIQLKEYNTNILKNLNYKLTIKPWIDEGITQEVINKNLIGYFPAGDQITIPHFDIEGRFIGLRGRTLCEEEGELYGKYRPLIANKQIYNHPLGLNLYNINNAKETIKKINKAVIFESEKSVLKAQSYFGFDNDIYVACCGSSISEYQIQLLKGCGAKEIVIAFDRDFEKIGDNKFNKIKNNLLKIHSKYKTKTNISFIFDKEMLTNLKDSPIDEGPEIFMRLFKNRIIL